jgi:tetratricopeptide (TPR) repeat protein
MSARHRRPVARLAFALSMLAFSATSASAGTIGFTITSTVNTGPGVQLVVKLTQNGDEPAYDVAPIAEFAGHTASGQTLKKLDPGRSHSWQIPVQSEDVPPGSHVMIVRVRYADANAYPFEVIATAPFAVGTEPKPPVTGSLAVPLLQPDSAADGTLTLNVPAARGKRFHVSIALPRGLQGKRTERDVTVGKDARLRVPLNIRNRGLLAGTSVNVYALVTSADESTPQTDAIRGVVRIGEKTAPVLEQGDVVTALVAGVVYLLVLELIAGFRYRREEHLPPTTSRWLDRAEAVLTCGATAFLLYHTPWEAMLAKTITAGGDMASHYYPAKLMAEEILPSGQITGWTMGNYAGFAIFHFYSTLPFAVIALIGKILPMQQVFKFVTMSGVYGLPLAAGYLFRSLGYRRGAAVIAATSTLPFLLQQGNSMWGGNIPSVLAGEFSHSIGLTLSLVFLGVLNRTVHGKRHWPLAALLLAAIGLSHTFAFLGAVWSALFYLWPRRGTSQYAPPVLATYFFAFLLLCFWGLPIPARLVFTSEWSMIWRIKSWQEVLPAPLWPAGVLAAANVLLMLVRLKAFRAEQQGILMFCFGGGLLLYYLVPAIGFPDIRFIPLAQLFLGLLAADFLYWLGSRFRHQLVYASCILLAGLVWGQSHLGYVPSWLKWNYTGYEGKPTWPLFKQINDHLRGDVNDPRVVFEHSQAHNRFGSSRAFENLPLFAGRSTLEGVFHQASQNSPFIFYLQSEASERGSGPFPQYTYTRLDPNKALPHLRLYDVSQIIVVSDKARAAYDENPAFTKSFESGSYAIYDIQGGDTGYVVPAGNEPVLYDGPNWKLAFYRWYKHPELLDIPLVPKALLNDAEAREFAQRTDTVTRIPRVPYTSRCDVQSHLEQYRITFDTNCPGRPHIVKVSYFPRWRTTDGSRLVPVSPGFMLVYPKGTHVELVYGRNLIDWLGLAISAIGLVLLLACWISPRLADAAATLVARPFGPLLRVFERHRILLSILLLAAAVAGGAATRMALRAPDKAYKQAQEAYKARNFDEAIKRMERWVATDRDTFKQATMLYQLGVSYSEVGNPAAALAVHERLRFQFPNVNYGAGTLFHMARNAADLKMIEKARHYAEQLQTEFPDSSWSTRLRRERPALFTDEPTS